MIEHVIRQGDDIHKKIVTFEHRLAFLWDQSYPIEISVKPYQDKISRSQQNLYWKWLGVIADGVSSTVSTYTKEDMHDLMRHKFLGTEEVVIGVEMVSRLPSTKKLGKGEMAEYMGKIEAWAADLGILVPIPADNEYMKYREAQ